MNQPPADIGYLLNKAARRVRLGLAEALTPTGLTPQQAAVVLAVARSVEGQLTPREVAESIDTDAATMSGLLDRLVRDGWLISAPNPRDGRSRLVALSERAAGAMPEILGAAEAASAQAAACLSTEEVLVLVGLLTRLCKGVETVTINRKAGDK